MMDYLFFCCRPFSRVPCPSPPASPLTSHLAGCFCFFSIDQSFFQSHRSPREQQQISISPLYTSHFQQDKKVIRNRCDSAQMRGQKARKYIVHSKTLLLWRCDRGTIRSSGSGLARMMCSKATCALGPLLYYFYNNNDSLQFLESIQ